MAGTILTLIAVRRHSSGAHAFVLTKPISIHEIAKSRFGAVFGQMILPGTVLLVLLSGLIAFELVTTGVLPSLPTGMGRVEWLPGQLLYVLFMYMGVLTLAWCALWCGVTIPIGVWWVHVFATFYFSMLSLNMLTNQFDIPLWGHGLIALFTVVPVAAIWTRGIRRRLLPTAGRILLATPIVIVSLYASLELLEFMDEGPLLIVVGAAAILPFALTPQFVEYQRHQ